MKSLTDLQWYDSNGNLVKSYDANTNAGPSILYFDGVSEKPVVLPLPTTPVANTTYVLKLAYDTQDGWSLAWEAEQV